MNVRQKFGYTLLGAGIILVGIIIGSAVSTLTAQPVEEGRTFAEILEVGFPLELQDYSDDHVKMVIGVRKACVSRLGASNTSRDLLELVQAYDMARHWDPLAGVTPEKTER